VPIPHAVDDHQTTNARFLSEAGAAWLVPQAQLQAAALADHLQGVQRDELLRMAQAAHGLRKLEAVDAMVQACEALAS
jgi:UDP-N-acetylglucosamine--N-acetylmuramyl-(pentapeptide) pyrophosphoryl-undecaprenol N-acetylglucosamine transferase